MRSRLATLSRLAREARGVTAIEFGIVCPVMMLLIMGLGDMAYEAYAKAILSGAIQKAARDSAIQGGSDQVDDLDQRVLAQIKVIAAGATYTSTRKSYSSFASMKPENFTDKKPYNGKYDKGECFDDINGNKTWDADPGLNGQGGANDVTLYTMNVTYTDPFPGGLFGWPPKRTISATTLLKNQPYATQAETSTVNICT